MLSKLGLARSVTHEYRGLDLSVLTCWHAVRCAVTCRSTPDSTCWTSPQSSQQHCRRCQLGS
eukprot:3141986-Amphidinium_carterae.1